MLEDMTEMTPRRSLDFDEVVMVEGALQLKTKTANDIFIPLSKVSAIEKDAILDEDTLAMIYSSGHSRIPVYQRMHDSEGRVTDDISSITAILLTRQLMVVDSGDGRRVSTLPLFEPICVSNNMSLLDLLHVFKQREHKKESKNYGRASHLAIVCINPDLANLSLDKGSTIPKEACVLGIVTLEDIIEQIVQENIEDECRNEEVKAKTRARKVFQKWRGSTIKKKASSIVPFEIDAKKNQLLVYN
jgi:metal transporter CNNM